MISANNLELFPFVIDEQFEGKRLDLFLKEILGAKSSRAQIQELIKKGSFMVDSKPAKSSQNLKLGQEVSFKLGGSSKKKALSQVDSFTGKEPKVLFEDDNLAVVTKPVGLAVHMGPGHDSTKTLCGWLVATRRVDLSQDWPRELVEQERVGIVHRLDKDTSGLMIVAKNPDVHDELSKAFAQKKIQRRYWCMVCGDVLSTMSAFPQSVNRLLEAGHFGIKRNDRGIWSLASLIQRDPKNALRFRTGFPKGKRAVSHFRVAQSGLQYSLLEFELDTGRTHQIRVHCRSLSLSIFGDPLYGGQKGDRLMLDSHFLCFKHPVTGKKLEFEETSDSFIATAKVMGLDTKWGTWPL